MGTNLFRKPQKLNDDSLMSYGKAHRGKKLANVPADYLIWCYENVSIPNDLKEYIKDNLDVLKQECKK